MNISERKKIHIPIQKGKLKGKKIPLPPSLNGHRNFTSSLIKEAMFQLIENYYGIKLDGNVTYHIGFFDLCAGSGQIGMEAYSRGFHPVHIVERDKKRFDFILENLRNYKIKGSHIYFHQKDFRRLADDIVQISKSAVFIDLPYSFWNSNTCLHLDHFFYKFFKTLKEKYPRIENKKDYKYIVIVQSPKPYPLKEQYIPGEYIDISVDIKHYRKHYLNLFKIKLTQL